MPSSLSAYELLLAAIENPPGIKIVASDGQSAMAIRRQLYGTRRRARERSDTSMDGLSIIVKGREVRVIVRDEQVGARVNSIEKVMPLRLDEVPAIIGSRGPESLSLQGALAVLELLAENPRLAGIR